MSRWEVRSYSGRDLLGVPTLALVAEWKSWGPEVLWLPAVRLAPGEWGLVRQAQQTTTPVRVCLVEVRR